MIFANFKFENRRVFTDFKNYINTLVNPTKLLTVYTKPDMSKVHVWCAELFYNPDNKEVLAQVRNILTDEINYTMDSESFSRYSEHSTFDFDSIEAYMHQLILEIIGVNQYGASYIDCAYGELCIPLPSKFDHDYHNHRILTEKIASGESYDEYENVVLATQQECITRVNLIFKNNNFVWQFQCHNKSEWHTRYEYIVGKHDYYLNSDDLRDFMSNLLRVHHDIEDGNLYIID